MSSRLFLLVLIMVLHVFSCLSYSFVGFAETSGNTVFSTESDVKLAITAAQERIVVCYQAVAEADRAGANTTALLAALNEAGHLLSKANWALEMGDLDSALSLSLLSQERLNDFVAEANVLKEHTIQRHYWDFIVNVVGSIVGTLVVICGSFVVWLILRRRR